MCLNKRDLALKEINFDIIPRTNQQVKFLIGCVDFSLELFNRENTTIRQKYKDRKAMCKYGNFLQISTGMITF